MTNQPLEKKKLLGKGKSGYSYLIDYKGEEAVLKQIHDEPCPYYHFDDKFKAELQAYEKLSALNLPIPELLEANESEQYIIKEYIEGNTAAELIAKDRVGPKDIEQLFKMCQELYPKQLNIDYFPTNFVLSAGTLFYIDYETNPYSEEWNLENWGIFYWANQQGMKNFLETGDHGMINQTKNSGIPIKEPYIGITNQWINQYSTL